MTNHQPAKNCHNSTMGNMFFILHNKVAHILFTESGTLYIIIIDLPLNKKINKKKEH